MDSVQQSINAPHRHRAALFLILGVVVVVLAFVLLIAGLFHASHTPTQASRVDGALSSPKPNPTAPLIVGADSNTSKENGQPEPLSVTTTQILSEYQADEKSASEKYSGKRVGMDGVLTGVFIPSFDTRTRMASEGHNATAFVTLGGPVPQSPLETLLLPGVVAYSVSDSVFGRSFQDQAAADFIVGKEVRLNCTVSNGRSLNDANFHGRYQLILSDCTFAAASKSSHKAILSVLGLAGGESPYEVGNALGNIPGYTLIGCKRRAVDAPDYFDCNFLRTNGDTLEVSFYKAKLQRIDFSFAMTEYSEIVGSVTKDFGAPRRVMDGDELFSLDWGGVNQPYDISIIKQFDGRKAGILAVFNPEMEQVVVAHSE